MKHSTVSFSIFVTGLMLAAVLAGLVANSRDGDICRFAPVEIGPGAVNSCNATPSPPQALVDQPTPTPAPPRLENTLQSDPPSREMAKSQPVFLQVETDQREIEVSWAAP
jgi:hypothetical protein